MTEATDAALVLRCRNGDRQAFDALLGRHARQVYGAVFRILHDREDAFDVTQTAFLTAYEHLDRYDPGRPFRSWLFRIAINQALDVFRARRPAEGLAEDTIDGDDGPEEAAERGEDDVAMQAALLRLRVDQRAVIVLKHLQGCSYEEIALILECPVKTVKSRLFSARHALRDILVTRGYF